jgi:hypothetical protein
MTGVAEFRILRWPSLPRLACAARAAQYRPGCTEDANFAEALQLSQPLLGLRFVGKRDAPSFVPGPEITECRLT